MWRLYPARLPATCDCLYNSIVPLGGGLGDVMRRGVWLRAIVAGVTLGAVGLICHPAYSGDLSSRAQPAASPCAVDGLNGKIAGFGGSFANDGVYGGAGSLTTPLTCDFGAQIDGNAASFDGRFLGTIGGHLFWRNPNFAMLGVYGSYTDWDRAGGVRAGHVGGEGAWYAGRFTLQGIAGVEFGNTTSETNGLFITTYDVKTRFFDQVDLGYYPWDNFEVYAGHRYLYGKHALALGGEWGIPLSNGVMAALFAEGRIGEDDYHGVWGGIRFYFGQKDKSLIRRHREDDPTGLEDGMGVSNGGSTSPVPSSSQGTTTCPQNFFLQNGACVPQR